MAQHDSRNPAIIVTASAAFSLAADVILVAFMGKGLPGAAFATVVAQYLSLGALLWVCYQPGSLRPTWPQAARAIAEKAAAAGRGGREGIISFRNTVSNTLGGGVSAFHRGGGWETETSPPPEPDTEYWESEGPSSQAASDVAGLVAAQTLAPAGGFPPFSSSALISDSEDSPSDLEASPEPEDLLTPPASLGAAAAAAESAAEVPPSPHPGFEPLHSFEGKDAALASASLDAPVATASTASVDGAPASHTHHTDHGSSAARRGAMLAAVYGAKVVCYFIVQGSAMRLAMTELAAHNAMFSLWNVCAYFPMPLQTTALTFVPRCDSDEVRFRSAAQRMHDCHTLLLSYSDTVIHTFMHTVIDLPIVLDW